MGYEIYQIKAKKERLWIEILNKSDEEDLKIKKKKNSILGFLVTEPENLNFKHETKLQAITENMGRVDRTNEENKKGDFYLGMILHTLAETLLIKQQKQHQELSKKRQTILIYW